MGFRDKASQWAKQNILSSKQESTEQGQQQHLGGVGDSRSALSKGGRNLSAKELHFQAGPEDNTTASSAVALSVECVDFLGDVHSATTFVKRDLGFAGQIGKHVLLSYGDTMYSDEKYSDQFRGMTSDSVALATHDPLTVVDSGLKDGYPPQFCPIVSHYGEEMSTCALGITNAVETNPGEGIIYFLLNHRPNGTDNLKGAGVATVTIPDGSVPYPNIKRLGEYWWDGDKEPRYGDVGAIRRNGYIYAYGHAKDNPWVYVTRVKWQEATKMDCYEYWNGETWQKDRLQTKDLTEKESTFWQVNQGQVIWSNYHSCFLFIYCDNFMSSTVHAQTAPAPEGPWSQPVALHKQEPITNGSTIYAAAPHPYYDPSGKTLVVTFTNHPNTIQAIKITFA